MEPQERTHELEERAAGLADGVVEKIASLPREYAQHQQFLYDLKTELIELCARPVTRPGARDGIPGDDLKWELARNMPDFSTESLYQKRSSFLSMGGIVFFGYLLGGLLSTVLGWLGMGGDIIRVVTVWGMFYVSEYLSANPKARFRLLAFLGLGTLAKFTVDLLTGMLQLTSWAGIKRAVFGSGGAPGLLKRWYLLLGAAFLFVFLSKKVTALDVTAFRHSLRKQAEERVRFLLAFFEELERLEAELAALQPGVHPDRSSVKCPKSDCLLTEKLAAVGYVTAAPGAATDEYLVWNDAEHGKFYDMIGLVRDGDRCRILKRAYAADEKIVKGYVQRETGSGK